jgi:YbgC/YbaW family acyl-CoA thioester hydrolase
MAFRHASTFRVRHYECDANRHLNNAGYLRYSHDAQIEALASAGLDPSSPSGAEGRWRASQVFIDYLCPLKAGDTVRVMARIVSLQTDRALWEYEFQEAGTEATCARAQIAYALQGVTNARPQPFHPGLEVALQPPEAGAQAGMVEPTPIQFPTLPPRPPGALTGPWQVEWRDVDQDWRLKDAAYLEYCSEFITRASADIGWPFTRFLEEGPLWHIKKQWLRILKPITLGDELTFATWLSNLKRATALRHYTIHQQDSGACLAEAHMLWVAVDPLSGRPTRIPEAFVRDYAPQIASVEV